MDRQFAVVTEASFGAGYDLAVICAQEGFDLLLASTQPDLDDVAQSLRAFGSHVETVYADVTQAYGAEQVIHAIQGRPVDALLVHTRLGLELSYLEQDFATIQRVVDSNVAATLALTGYVAWRMRERGSGSILLAGSCDDGASVVAVQEATAEFLECLASALREELKHSGVAVAHILPGALAPDTREPAETGERVGSDFSTLHLLMPPADAAGGHAKYLRPLA